MRAIVIREPGGPEVLELAERGAPAPGRMEIRVGVRASGVNRADLIQRRGSYPAPAGWPDDIPGLEFTGEVAEVGPGVRRWQVGDRVMGLVGGGAYAEQVVVHEDEAVAVPPGLDFDRAGAIPEAFFTAFDALDLQCGLRPGETLLIHAVGSGVGTAALQIARRAGVRTIGTSRTPGKLARAVELGLEVPISGGAETEWAEAVLAATGGRGVDVILDLVGGTYLEANQRVIAERGRWIVVGVPSGPRATIDLRSLMGRRASVTGTVLRARPLHEKIALARAVDTRLMEGFEDGSLEPVVDRTFPAEDAAEAHRRMEANENFGKLVLTWA
jgi:putative PIG3 family NAD(P)H quinone oxidoreductase